MPSDHVESYHNTTALDGDQLDLAIKDADSQDAIVLRYFRTRLPAGARVTPARVWKDCFNTRRVPLTSVRRAMTTLKKRGQLKKLDEFTEGQYGKKVHLWTLTELDRG